MNHAIILVSVCAGLVGISYGMYAPLVPVFSIEELGADYSQVGIIGMANYLPYMFAPFFVGLVLDRTNKSYVLAAGVALAGISVYMLSSADSVPEVIFLRLMAGVAHALFWPSSEVLISANSDTGKRVRGISFFIAAWILGFMVGPLLGTLVLDLYDFRILFQAASIVALAGIVPSLFLRHYGAPAPGAVLNLRASDVLQVGREMSRYPAVSAVLLYYAVTFGVVLAVYPAYMGEAAISSQNIEYLFFFFGVSRFATLYFVPRLSGHGILALSLAVAATAVGMLISFAFASFLGFAAALVLVGLATSIFYPITFSIVTKNTPLNKMGQKLGAYETMFGIGWAIGPLAVGFSSNSFGSSSPYLGLFVMGTALAAALAVAKR
jgi:MFS family permease